MDEQAPKPDTRSAGQRITVDCDYLLTFAEGCTFLKMSPRWVWARVKNGTLPHLRFGKAIRFRRSSLVEWCAGQEKAVRL